MKRCPITYEVLHNADNYSEKGLKLLSKKLNNLKNLELSAEELRMEAIVRAPKMSLQGVQPKLSAILNVKESQFEIVDQNGKYILKPQSLDYPELPQNEAITMTLAETIGLEVPLHGLIYAKDNSMTYFIQRFDRKGRIKLSQEDFAQLSQKNRQTKYKSSMEKIAKIIEFCTFPRIESIKLFKLVLFNFLTGNEDAHLKNFSLITRSNKIILSPAYDLLNTTIVILGSIKEELALPLNGKKNNLTKKDFIDYFAIKILKINSKVINSILDEMQKNLIIWKKLIKESFLSTDMQSRYLNLLEERSQRLGL